MTCNFFKSVYNNTHHVALVTNFYSQSLDHSFTCKDQFETLMVPIALASLYLQVSSSVAFGFHQDYGPQIDLKLSGVCLWLPPVGIKRTVWQWGVVLIGVERRPPAHKAFVATGSFIVGAGRRHCGRFEPAPAVSPVVTDTHAAVCIVLRAVTYRLSRARQRREPWLRRFMELSFVAIE